MVLHELWASIGIDPVTTTATASPQTASCLRTERIRVRGKGILQLRLGKLKTKPSRNKVEASKCQPRESTFASRLGSFPVPSREPDCTGTPVSTAISDPATTPVARSSWPLFNLADSCSAKYRFRFHPLVIMLHQEWEPLV